MDRRRVSLARRSSPPRTPPGVVAIARAGGPTAIVPRPTPPPLPPRAARSPPPPPPRPSPSPSRDAPPSEAITANSLLFLEAWRAVDHRRHVQQRVNWFKYREDTVKKVSMDSTDETYDAIRAMLAKLDDPFTKFLEP